MRLAASCLSVIDDLGSKPEDIVRTVGNMKAELESAKRQLKAFVSQSIRNLEPVNIGGVDVYSGVFPTSDRSVLTDAAEMYRKKGAVIAFIGVGDNLAVMVGSGCGKVDCKTILSETLSEFGGRGGGKPDFAQGGVQDVTASDKVLASLMNRIKNALENA